VPLVQTSFPLRPRDFADATPVSCTQGQGGFGNRGCKRIVAFTLTNRYALPDCATGVVNIVVACLKKRYVFNIITLGKCIPPLGTISLSLLNFRQSALIPLFK
jgi:hypothetical protein